MRNLAPFAGKEIAGLIVSRAKKAGEIPAATACVCVDCGAQARDYDHRDYNLPLQIVPVCRRCNIRRGPAIPLVGAFRETVNKGLFPYRKTTSVARIFTSIGADMSVLTGLPAKLKLTHWELIVPEFERAYMAYANRSA